MSHSDNDDVWGESDGEDQITYERNLAEKQWERMQEDHGNVGYKEGIVEGKEVNMQRGFDRGYSEGLSIGKSVGKLRGVVSTQIVFYGQILKNEEAVEELQQMYDELDKIEVNNAYSVDYFREDGPKSSDYVSPSDYVMRLEEKVNKTIEDVRAKYSS